MVGGTTILEQAPNLRDLGGVRAKGGLRVRTGLLFRSEALDTLSEADVQTLATLGIRVACDLRSGDERARHPSRWPAVRAPELLTLPAAGELKVDPDHILGMVSRDVDGARTREYMLRAYRAMPLALAGVFRPLFERIARRDLPLLVHCAAGKDRTGFVCATLLGVLGVPDDAIEADYLQSREHVSPERVREALAARGLEAPDAAIEAFMVREEYLAAADVVVLQQWGSPWDYLETAAGVPPEAVADAKHVLLEP